MNPNDTRFLERRLTLWERIRGEFDQRPGSGWLDTRVNIWKMRPEARADCLYCWWKGPWREYRRPYDEYFVPIGKEIEAHFAIAHTPLYVEDTRSAPTATVE